MKESNLISVSRDYAQSGFTLLEILIAITLLAFITLGVVNITENAALTMERTTEINKNNLQIETALSRFEWDFSQIYSPLYFSTVMNLNQQVNAAAPNVQGGTEGAPPGAAVGQISPELQLYYEQIVTRFERNERFSGLSKEGLPIPLFYSPEKEVFEFFTSSNRRKVENLKQSHFAWVRYSLAAQDSNKDSEQNPNIPGSLKSLVRYYSADDPYGEQRLDIEDTKGSVLLENVEKLEFQFWDLGRRKWETSLRSVTGGENLLRGVKILVTWYDNSGHKRTVERIFRNNWPMVVPKDPVARPTTTPTTTTTAGAAGGTTVTPPPEGDDDD